MIKLVSDDDSPHEAGREAMRELLHRRAASGLFDSGVADRLIGHSGGHPRDLLRLVRYLLYNLALLEYNDFYWRSHPVIRTTREYMMARRSLTQSDE